MHDLDYSFLNSLKLYYKIIKFLRKEKLQNDKISNLAKLILNKKNQTSKLLRKKFKKRTTN